MQNIYMALVSIVALQHIGFLILEMFLWTHPIGMNVFAMKPEMAQMTKTLAMNQGLYNGFLAAGLIWGLVSEDYHLHIFFLGCVIVAGIFGAFTVSPKIFLVQALPAILALAFLIYITTGETLV